MITKLTGLAAAAMLLAGCIIIDADKDGFRTDFDADQRGYGSVFAADVSANSVAFQVTSNGCTSREFFDVDVIKEGVDAYELGLRRTRQDNCRALLPEGTTISWSFSELGIPDDAEVSVRNQVRR